MLNLNAHLRAEFRIEICRIVVADCRRNGQFIEKEIHFFGDCCCRGETGVIVPLFLADIRTLNHIMSKSIAISNLKILCERSALLRFKRIRIVVVFAVDGDESPRLIISCFKEKEIRLQF